MTVARLLALLLLTSAPALLAGCDKMPLVAPTGTVITLYANSTVLPINGSIEITAVAIEAGSASTGTTGGTGGTTAAPAVPAAGTPVHNGTVITFTTTLGTIDPVEARTHNGQVTVRLSASGASGVATVRAFSGGATSNELKVNVGSAAAARIDLTANPTTLPSTGGIANLIARVFDTNGNPLPGVPVGFSIDTGGGTLGNSTVVTDSNGNAANTIATNRETTVVATAGVSSGTSGSTTSGLSAKITIRVNTASTLTITSSTAAPVQNQPVTFTITSGGGTAGTTNVIRNVTVSFGDGAQVTLGSISGATTISHIYRNAGSWQVTALGSDINGESVSGTTIVSVTEQLPLAVTVTATPSTARKGEDPVTFTATVSGGSPILFIWDFGDGQTATTTGPSTQHLYACGLAPGPVRVTVRVQANNAGEGLAVTTVVLTSTTACP